MIVLDTHAWLWWVGGDPRLSRAARRAVESDGEIGVSTVSVWEVATLERLGRIALLPDLRTWVRRALAFPGDPADRIVYATALATGSRLVTADRRLARLDPDRVVW